MQLNTSAWNRCTNWKNHGITSSRKYLPDHVHTHMRKHTHIENICFWHVLSDAYLSIIYRLEGNAFNIIQSTITIGLIVSQWDLGRGTFYNGSPNISLDLMGIFSCHFAEQNFITRKICKLCKYSCHFYMEKKIWSDQITVLHISWQLSCCDMCKFVIWLYHKNHN